jgi:hypothetical protein
VAIAAVSAVVAYELRATEHAGMENCPLHSKPSCPLHGEKHGTHDCDCPTIGCARTDTGFIAYFGTVGLPPVAIDMPVPVGPGEAAVAMSPSVILLAFLPLSPPPRT